MSARNVLGHTLAGDLRAASSNRFTSQHLPMSREELDRRGIDSPDVLLVTGDAYIDHPSFAMAILGRLLEALGMNVVILSQPPWKSADAWRAIGRPRLFVAVSAGNMDSMINHYTASRLPRSDDAYSPGGRVGLRPDRATAVYCQRAREAFPGVPIIAGGVEASLRRLAHYDYWSDTVRPSMLVSAKCDLLVHGMGERPLHEIALRLAAGASPRDLRDMPGVAYLQGASESAPLDAIVLPSFEEISPPAGAEDGAIAAMRRAPAADLTAFARATRMIHHETNPLNARVLVQSHGGRNVVVNPSALPLDTEEMDLVYGLPYRRTPHPVYSEKVPAEEVIRDSVTIMRGCFGGCTFCSITMHQGRVISSRSEASILTEVKAIAAEPNFKGTVSDLGGPTANMYRMRCTRPEVEAVCRRLSCVHPTVCKLLGTDHEPLIDLMQDARKVKRVKRVNIASGIRMDLARKSERYMSELAAHHVGGHLKVAPEHIDERTLALMKKPSGDDFENFAAAFKSASQKAGKPDQFLVPYFIGSHPGSTLEAMIDLAVYLKRNGYRPRQVQDFIPAPMDIATCMYYTGLDPMSGKEVPVARALGDRRLQRALLHFWKPESYFKVRRALMQAGRSDLIGNHPDALIPESPPPEALAARREQAQRHAERIASKIGAGAEDPGTLTASIEILAGERDNEEGRYSAAAPDREDPDGDHVHSRARTPPSVGYRPGRKRPRKRD